MQQQVRCKKCGRVLKSPASIAMGMGPKCARVSGGRKSVRIREGRRGGTLYSSGTSSGTQVSFPTGEIKPKRLSKKEIARRNREERRRLFDKRQPFQCGLLLPERKPIIYTPTEDGGWQDSTNGRVIPHEQLQNYLKRYQFI
jgi:hypothetical protein